MNGRTSRRVWNVARSYIGANPTPPPRPRGVGYWDRQQSLYRSLKRGWRQRNHTVRGNPRPPRRSIETSRDRAVRRGEAEAKERTALLRKHNSLRGGAWCPIQNLRRRAALLKDTNR